MLYRKTIVAATFIGAGVLGGHLVPGETLVFSNEAISKPEEKVISALDLVNFEAEPLADVSLRQETSEKKVVIEEKDEDLGVTTQKGGTPASVFTVPFYSQFSDISAPQWQKVGCGIASLAMLIDFYEPEAVTVDELLQEGIDADAYQSEAGWTHTGLISLSNKYGLTGESHDLAGVSMDSAFATLKSELKRGPVIASVHYAFSPTNPIPHLVVVNGVSDGKVFYNDPSEKAGGHSISISQFQGSWKKRYIDIRPIS